jgi:hypothetical protein
MREGPLEFGVAFQLEAHPAQAGLRALRQHQGVGVAAATQPGGVGGLIDQGQPDQVTVKTDRAVEVGDRQRGVAELAVAER